MGKISESRIVLERAGIAGPKTYDLRTNSYFERISGFYNGIPDWEIQRWFAKTEPGQVRSTA